MITIKLITMAIATLILLFVVELIRREKLTFKYGFGWIVICILAMTFSVFDGFLFALAEKFGFILPSNFIFFSLISAIVFLILLMTIFLCQQDRHNNIIAQKVALLEEEIVSLKRRLISSEQTKK
jgi:hypothetical protein